MEICNTLYHLRMRIKVASAKQSVAGRCSKIKIIIKISFVMLKTTEKQKCRGKSESPTIFAMKHVVLFFFKKINKRNNLFNQKQYVVDIYLFHKMTIDFIYIYMAVKISTC